MAEQPILVENLELPGSYLKAGRNYMHALEELGMRPSGLLWAWDHVVEEWVLVLVTDQLDAAGPTELFRLLTLAHNMAATPKEISPFIIRLQSWTQPNSRRVVQILGMFKSENFKDEMRAQGADILASDKMQNPRATVDDLTIDPKWVYRIDDKKPKPVDRQREWRRFKRNVEALAA